MTKLNAMDIAAFISAVTVVVRLFPFLRHYRKRYTSRAATVSVIIPARNEEKNLPVLLNSLQALQTKPAEIIVVDDRSTDSTAKVAAQFGASVISAGPRPSNWAGKNWVCHVGAKHATSEFLLFTDADTVHNTDSLGNALAFLQTKRADMISSAPYHRNACWWERLLGPFFCILNCGGSPFDKPTTDDPYAVGQYILVSRSCYDTIGGHEAVRNVIAEDVGLAREVIKVNGRYCIYHGNPLYSVQMYNGFSGFCRGWIRLMRLGMRNLSVEIVFYSMLPLLALNVVNWFRNSSISFLPAIIVLISFMIVQRKLGNFSILGILLFPFSVILFVMLSCVAVVSDLLKKPIKWKGRVYEFSGQDS